MIRALGLALASTIGLGACAPDPPAAVVAVRVAGCGAQLEQGVGTLVEPGLILTSAHVVAGARTIEVVNSRGDEYDARILAFDPANDLALLKSDVVAVPIGIALDSRTIGDNTSAVVYLTGFDGSERREMEVVRRVSIETEDIYIDRDVTRPGFELAAEIDPGDSGAAVVLNGEVIGVVWARSRQADRRAYAIDPVAAGGTIAAQRNGSTDLPALDRCD